MKIALGLLVVLLFCASWYEAGIIAAQRNLIRGMAANPACMVESIEHQ